VARDPGAPRRPLRKEVVLLCGFLLCLLVAVISVVLPELSGEAPASDATQRAATGAKAAPAPTP
jgi:hypothetical protein